MFYIKSNEINYKIEAALKGNAKVANELSQYFEYSKDSKAVENRDMALYWLLIAAENDTAGFYMKDLSSYLISSNQKNHSRGFFWLYLSAKNGHDDAKKDIESIYHEYIFYLANDSDLSENNISDIAMLTELSIHGSGKAALLLAYYYKKKNDYDNYKYWLRIGAQNGSKECMKEYADLLRKSSDKYDNIRAEFWEKRSKP